MSTDEKRQARELLDDAVQQLPEEPKKGCRKGCRRGCLILAILFAFPIYWIGCHTTPMRISHETTRALGPMTSDGKRVDYFRAYEEMYYPPEMKTDDNGYRLIVRALGCPIKRSKTVQDPITGKTETMEIDGEPLRLQTYEKLGLDPDVPPTIFSDMKQWSSYEPIREETERRNKENPEEEIGRFDLYDKLMGTPWTLEEYPFMEDWLKRSGPALDLIGEAVRKPTFKIPYIRENENTPIFESLLPLEEVQMTREWARTLQTRIRYRLGIGDIDGAIDDTITCHLLARHIGKHGTLVAYLVGIAIEGVATAVGIAENPEYPPTKEQIQRLMAELDKLPPRRTAGEAFESERFFSLAAMQDLYWGNSPESTDNDSFLQRLYPFMSWTMDINISMERINGAFDVLAGENVDEGILPNRDNISWNPFPMLTVRGRTNRINDVLISLLLPATEAAREAYRRCECMSNMQRLTLALLLYEKDHGGMRGGDWREAVKPYLGADVDRYFHCPTHRTEPDETTYAMVSGVENPSPTPQQILIIEVYQPQKLVKGDGRFPMEKAKFWRRNAMNPGELRPNDFDGLGSYHTGGINVGLRNGSVRFISETIAPEELDKLLHGTATEFP